MEKKLLTLDEFCRYLGIGQTKAREIMHGGYGFAIRIGNRWYVVKDKLDEWLNTNAR